MSLSLRGKHARDSQGEENLVWKVCADLWDPLTNPEGYVSLGMAENSLMHEELRDFLSQKALIDEDTKAFTYGDGPSGSKNIKTVLSTFLNEYLRPVREVRPEHLVVTNGVTSALEHTTWAIANPGCGILVGRPYYRAFIMDMELRPGVRMVPVSFEDVDPCVPDCVRCYEKALLAARQNGVEVRALLLCHPHNPLGRCYPRQTLVNLMKLCEKYRIHLISDEIYALSVWQNTIDDCREHNSFESVLSIETDGIISPDLVHVLWGISKDFGANGLRLGVLVSQANPGLLAACRACGIFSSPSSLAENAVAHILSDRTFLKNYLCLNKTRLSEAYIYAVRKLDSYGITYLPGASAAFFVWVDLGRSCLSPLNQDKSVSTDAIYHALLEKKVFTVSGDATGAEESGWFRLVFTQRQQLVDEALFRISEVVRELRGVSKD